MLTFKIRHRNLFLSLTLVFILVSPLLNAVGQKVRFHHYGTNDGLSDNIVTSIYQDRDGFLWIGTTHGVNRYDGSRFITYHHSSDDTTTLSSNRVYSLAQDTKDNLWVGTSNGISLLDIKTDKVIRHFTHQNTGGQLIGNRIEELYCASDGTMWIGTPYGLSSYHPDDDQFQSYEAISDSNQVIKDIVEDAHSNIWVATTQGLHFINRITREVTDLSQSENPLFKHSSALFINNEGLLWVGADNGRLGAYKIKENHHLIPVDFAVELSTKNFSPVNKIQEADNGDIWIGTGWAGIYILSKKNHNIQHAIQDADDPNSLSWNVILSMYKSRDGSMWIGTYGAGLDMWHPSFQNFELFQYGRNENQNMTIQSVNAIVADRQDRIWVSGFGKGTFNMIDRHRNTVKDLSNLLGFQISCMHLDPDQPDKYMWLLTDYTTKQLNKFDIQSLKLIETYSLNPPNQFISFYNISADTNHNLWIASSQGVIQFSISTGKSTVHDGFISSVKKNQNYIVYDCFVDSTQKIWIATSHGAYHYDPVTKLSERYTYHPHDSTALSSNSVYNLLLDQQNQLWLGTDDGLNKLNPSTNTFTHYNTGDGLISNLILAMEHDPNGHIWISSNRGLSRLDPLTNQITNYSVDDGLQSNDFSQNTSFKSDNGELFFGGTNGLNAFFPDKIVKNTFLPPVFITGFQLFNEEVPLFKEYDNQVVLQAKIEYTREIILSHKQLFLSFDVSALNFVVPSKNQYAYRMVGFDNMWHFIGHRQHITFTNLPAKTYHLQIKASNNDGIWNEATTQLKITITPPYYRTAWFIGLLSFFIIGSTFLVFFLRIHFLKKTALRLSEQVQERTQDLQKSNQLLREKNRQISSMNEEIVTQNEELAQHRNHLEHLVESRTRELQKAKEKAEESDKLKSAFLANMSHEIRTPLNAITGFSTILATVELSDEQKELYSSLIHSNTDDLLLLVDDILDLSKIESGQLTLSYEQVDLMQLMAELYTVFLQELEVQDKKHINLELFYHALSTTFYTDPFRLKQILSNLLNNAVKFTHAGSINFGYEAVHRKMIKFYVEDTGIGIPKDKLDSIFNRFSKVAPTGDYLYRGTGLGLTISNQLVQLLGGKLYVESIEGKGSRFFFTLPNKS